VYLEVGSKKVFACSYDWPGWCRSGKDEDAALAALAAYAARYRPVAERAGLRFPAKAGDDLEVADRVKGSGSTDFGVPGSVAGRDRDPLTAEQAARLAAVVEAAWATLADVAAGAPAVLAKGPRGGGRDRDQIVEHVEAAEEGYARKIGLRGITHPELRPAILDALRSARSAPDDPKVWPPRYTARRLAWHALDHAWEIEDKS
jgi:hypothetical protein